MTRWLFLTSTALAQAVALLSMSTLALGSAPALHIEEDLAGDVIVCDDATYTITSGTALLLFHEGVTPSGNFQGLFIFTTRDVVATDSTDPFLVHGDATGSAAANAKTGGVVQTFTTMLQIVDQGGGVVASVRLLAHLSPNGKTLDVDFGNCGPPV